MSVETAQMFMVGKTNAEAQLVVSERKAARAQEELETARQEKAELRLRLKSQRLAKAAADKKA